MQQKDRMVLAEPSLNPVVEAGENNGTPVPTDSKKVTINDKRSNSRSGSRVGMTPIPANQENNPLQKILAASYNFDDTFRSKPKTAALINDVKYGLFESKGNKKEFRPSTADLFRSPGDSSNDKKLSNKIIKELVNFVEGERQINRSSIKTPTNEKVQLFPLQKPGSGKTKITKSLAKQADVLTIED